MENEFLFVKNDTSAVMMYAPHEADDMDTTVNATATMNDTTNSTECEFGWQKLIKVLSAYLLCWFSRVT